MIKLLILLTLLLPLNSMAMSPGFLGSYSSQGEWILRWTDEFNGTAIDPTKWIVYNNCEWFSAQLNGDVCHKAANVEVSGGTLKLIVKKEITNDPECGANGVCNYSTGGIDTRGKQVFKYGKFVIRARFSYGEGQWPGIWTTGYPVDGDVWPATGEIDIMEHREGVEWEKLLSTLHFEDSGGSHVSTRLAEYTGYAGSVYDWHTYVLEWHPPAELSRIFVDGVQAASFYATETEFQRSHMFRFSEFIGGWGSECTNCEIDDDDLPGYLEVDYVRYYSRTSWD